MRTVWLIRHAESHGNAGGVTQSTQTNPLSAAGREHARAIAGHFGRAPDLIVVSGYIRTRETAEPLMERFPKAPVAEWDIHEFTYLSAALYDGTTQAARGGPAREYWKRSMPDAVEGEGAESFNSFIRRVRGLLERLRTEAEPFTAVFSHGYVLKAVIWELLYTGDPDPAAYMAGFHKFHRTFPVANGTVIPLQIADDGEIFIGRPWVPGGAAVGDVESTNYLD